MSNPSDTVGHRPSQVIAVANQKGGVGKTTTAINLATGLVAVGRTVCLIDLDPQGNATTGLGIPPKLRDNGSYQALLDGRPIADVMIPTGIPGLSLVTATVDLSGAEVELVGQEGREFRLRDAIQSRATGVDTILIDCPPSLGLLTVNALVAADQVLVPLQTEYYALEGLSHLMRTIDRIRRSLNRSLTLAGVVLTMFDRRNNLSEQVAADVRSHFGTQVFETVIPRNVRISEAPSHGKPVMLYDHRSPGALAYAHLASELLKRQGVEVRP
ncbi:MAG: ParA family protein [Alphaproteobacteria bacterium]|nr:ParA family protein [Alphaproteobacteria bacterium]TAD89053.1 MAG: ParA family protein [Alphaproteobacteria bacterium]